MLGIVLAIYSSFFWAISQLAYKKSFKELEASQDYFINALFGVLMWVPIALYFGIDIQLSTLPRLIFFALFAAIVSEALVIFALSKGQLSITSLIIQSYPVYIMIFSKFINSENLTKTQFLYIGLTIVGTLITFLPSKFSFNELKKSGAIFWPLLAAVGIGLSDSLSKNTIDNLGVYNFLFVLALVQVPVGLAFLKIEKQSVKSLFSTLKTETQTYKNGILGSVFNIIGTGLLFLSLDELLASVSSAITATSGAIVVLLSVIFFDEKLNFRVLFGMFALVLGVFGLSTTI
jgi:drug/metabolite transporter (DMT)-like permease